eukprot:gene164-219_t
MGVTHLSYAESTYKKPNNNSSTGVGEIKFGPHCGSGLLSRKAGLVGEYKLNDALGIQSGVLYFQNIYLLNGMQIIEGPSAVIQTHAIHLPIQMKIYPGNDRQFSFILGTRVGYIVSGRTFLLDNHTVSSISRLVEDEDKWQTKLKNLDNFKNKRSVALKDVTEQDKVQKLQLGPVIGFEYEFKVGITLGMQWYHELMEAIKTKNSILLGTCTFDLGQRNSK